MPVTSIFGSGGGGGGELPPTDPYTSPRTPKKHASTHASGGTDAVSAGSIGAATMSEVADAISDALEGFEGGGGPGLEIVGADSAEEGFLLQYDTEVSQRSEITATTPWSSNEMDEGVVGGRILVRVNGIPPVGNEVLNLELGQGFLTQQFEGNFVTLRLPSQAGGFAVLDLTNYSLNISPGATLQVEFDEMAQERLGFPATATVGPSASALKLTAKEVTASSLDGVSEGEFAFFKNRMVNYVGLNQGSGTLDIIVEAPQVSDALMSVTYTVVIESVVGGIMMGNGRAVAGNLVCQYKGDGTQKVLSAGATLFDPPPTAPELEVSFLDGLEADGGIICRVVLPMVNEYRVTLLLSGIVQDYS